VNPKHVNLPKNPPEENGGLIFGDERSGIKLNQEVYQCKKGSCGKTHTQENIIDASGNQRVSN
jgi:hypothetical protein